MRYLPVSKPTTLEDGTIEPAAESSKLIELKIFFLLYIIDYPFFLLHFINHSFFLHVFVYS